MQNRQPSRCILDRGPATMRSIRNMEGILNRCYHIPEISAGSITLGQENTLWITPSSVNIFWYGIIVTIHEDIDRRRETAYSIPFQSPGPTQGKTSSLTKSLAH